jgi:hypothetical protein
VLVLPKPSNRRNTVPTLFNLRGLNREHERTSCSGLGAQPYIDWPPDRDVLREPRASSGHGHAHPCGTDYCLYLLEGSRELASLEELLAAVNAREVVA